MEWDAGQRETVIEVIAAACHQQNRTYCGLMGDTTQPLWLDAPSWQKDSVIEGVKAALADPNPARSHERWLEHKRAGGWIYGPQKDPILKTHPCMLPYGDLPEAQRRKDSFFIEMVVQLGSVAGLINGSETT